MSFNSPEALYSFGGVYFKEIKMEKYFCGLCGKKLGFFEDFFWLDSETILCSKCKAFNKEVKESMDEKVTFEAKIEEFKERFPKEKHIQFITHWNNVYNKKTQAHEKEQKEREEQIKEENRVASECVDCGVNSNIGPFENQDLVYTIDGVRGRHIDIYKDKVVITVKVTLGSLITHNSTDGEKTIYYSDCIGVQFKQSKFAIGYLQLETASSSGNNKNSNFFGENSFTYDTTVISNERMIEVSNYVKSRVDAVKTGKAATVATNNTVSLADELLKLKQLLDMGVLTQEEFDEQKIKLLKG